MSLGLRDRIGYGRRPVPPELVAPGGTLVEARGVSVVLGGNRILDDVTLSATAGEVLALVGPNGAGKSTLLGTLAGDLEPSDGGVVVAGRPLGDWSPVELAQRRAVLPQQVQMAFPFTVHEIVRMGRSPWAGTDREDDDDTVVASALKRTDVAHLAGRRFPSLSGGERARVAMARVLAQQAQLVLLDEPTAALDLHHQEQLLQVARGRADDGDGVVAVLHDLGLAAAYADRVAVIAEGRLVSVGPPGDVLTPDLVSGVYHHDVDVFPNPRTGELVLVPRREPRTSPR